MLLQIEGRIGHMYPIVCEIFLDEIALIASANNEFVEPEMGIDLHDVPDDRVVSDLDHRLWLGVGLFRKAATPTAGQNDDLRSGGHRTSFRQYFRALVIDLTR